VGSKEPYEAGRRVGNRFERLILGVRDKVLTEDKSCVFMCIAPVRAGKSSLGFHAYELYSNNNIDLDTIGFSKEGNALAIDKGRRSKGFVMFDEFNLNRRESMSQYNRDFIDLLMAVAGLNLTLWCNNPSADVLDKVFLEEGLVNFFVFIYAPRRRFVIIPRNRMIKLLRDKGDLKYSTLKKFAKSYGVDSWFRSYKGDKWDEYVDLKSGRMDEKVDKFVEKYGKGELLSLAKASDVLGVHRDTLTKYLREEEEAERYKVAKTTRGYYQFSKDDVAYFEGVLE
jgi:hypothetical protein